MDNISYDGFLDESVKAIISEEIDFANTTALPAAINNARILVMQCVWQCIADRLQNIEVDGELEISFTFVPKKINWHWNVAVQKRKDS